MPWSALLHHGLRGCPWTALSLVSPYPGGPTGWEGGERSGGEDGGKKGEVKGGREGRRDDGEDETVQEDKGQNKVNNDTTLHFYWLHRMTQALTSKHTTHMQPHSNMHKHWGPLQEEQDR